MSDARIVNFFLDWHQRRAMDQAKPHMFARVKRCLEQAGWRVILRPDAERAQIDTLPGHHLVGNRPVLHPLCLNLRNAYMPAFWRIEDSNDRWNFTVAGQRFDAATIPPDQAQRFVARWRAGMLRGAQPVRDGYIFMPLQGVLLRQRHFQAMSPVQMIEATLQADPVRPVIATLHPKETYTYDEIAALHAIAARHSRFVLSDAASHGLLCGCDYVVTQNSSMVITGYFAEKPAVLFADIDFHHIAQSVPKLGTERAFARVLKRQPDFAAYLVWFMRGNAIAQFADDAETTIAARLQALGWPM
ncbi:MAG: hypothetical protein H7245_07790 [Candidatus Saccharibacteria bacterium]|nr:hypothetical protein [Pseudorhodobacter sp.]